MNEIILYELFEELISRRIRSSIYYRIIRTNNLRIVKIIIISRIWLEESFEQLWKALFKWQFVKWFDDSFEEIFHKELFEE